MVAWYLAKHQAGEFAPDFVPTPRPSASEFKITELERMAGKLSMEQKFLRGDAASERISQRHQRLLRLRHASTTIGGTIRCAKETVISPTLASPGRSLNRVPCDGDTSSAGRPFV